MNLKIQYANLSDVGKKRSANEDYYGFFEISGLKIFIVSDGMGGYKGGSTASHIVVNTFKEYLDQNSQNLDNIPELIKSALEQADSKIKQKANEDPDLKDMGATAVVLILKDDLAYIAHIGDSRAYIIRGREIVKITKDHSLVQQMVDGGIITEEQAKNHPKRNIITHSLGHGGKSDVEIQNAFQLYKDDILILCTDGLTGHVNDDEIKYISLNNEPATAVHKLIDLANERGGKDNITIQLVKILNGKRKPIDEKIKKKIINYSLYSIFGLALVAFFIIAGLLTEIFDQNGSIKKISNTDKDSIANTNNNFLKEDSLLNSSVNDSINLSPSDSLINKN